MKEKRNHDFEYYEEKAAYFQYTHSNDYDDMDINEAYLKLDAKVIEAVQKKAEKDATIGRRIGQRELERYIVQRKLVKAEDALAVLGDLYVDYELAYMGIEALREAEKRKNRI